MKLRPLDNGVIIKQMQAEDKTSGGIILPDNAKEKPMMGKVIAVGPGKILDNGTVQKMTVKKNDQVVYSKYMGSEVDLDGEKLVILKETEILGIVEK